MAWARLGPQHPRAHGALRVALDGSAPQRASRLVFMGLAPRGAEARVNFSRA